MKLKSKSSKQKVRIGAILLAFVMFILSVFPAYATKTVQELEQESSSLESELTDMEKELKTLDKELNQILSQIKATNSDLKEVREELAIAKSVDLVAVANALGYQTKRVGSYHTIKEMDSIRIYNRKTWYR